MNERERADWLARAIDDLLAGTPPPKTQEPTDDQLQSLLRVARARLDVSRHAAGASASYEDAVWQQLVARLEARGSRAESTLKPPTDSELFKDAIVARRKVTRDLAELADKHRDDVWSRIQARIADPERTPVAKRLMSWLRGPQHWPEHETPPASRTRLVPTGDADLDGLIRVALAQPPLRAQSRLELDETQVRVRRRMRNDPGRRAHLPIIPPARSPRMFSWTTAALGALLAVAIGALAPIPATGVARHPAVQAVEYVAHRVGVSDQPVA